MITMTSTTRPLWKIADEIMRKWRDPYFGAVPYINAMTGLESITDKYGHDDAEEIVTRFLVNAKGWRGEDAKRIKAELRAMLPRRSAR